MIINRKPKLQIGQTKKVKKFLIIPRWTDTQIFWLCFAELTYKKVRHEYYEGEVFIGFELINVEVIR